MCDEKDEYLLNHTKAVLKFLVNQRQGPQTVQSINNDFYKYTGRQIPYFELGYGYLVTFLYSIPDTLKVSHLINFLDEKYF